MVDPNGVQKTCEAWVEVGDVAWSASVTAPSEVLSLGSSVAIAPAVKGSDASGFTYNYVWNYEGAWQEWGSTVLDTGSRTPEASWDFKPEKSGRYQIFVDVVDPNGVQKTCEAWVSFAGDWSYEAVMGDARSILLGEAVRLESVIQGDPGYLSYRYRYKRIDGGQGDATTLLSDFDAQKTSYTWTPSATGCYEILCDVKSADGTIQTHTWPLVVWNPAVLTPVSHDGGKTWIVAPELGVGSDPGALGFTFNYVWNLDGAWAQWGSTLLDEGAATTKASWTFAVPDEGRYEIYVDIIDPEGNKRTLSSTVVYAPSGKIGWQNPAGYYQVSSFNVAPHPSATGVFAYMTPSRIPVDASRGQCIDAFVGRAWEYIGTPYVWNYACAPGVGVDCIGLVYQCAYAAGMDLGEFNPYDHYATGPSGWHSHDAMNMWNYGNIQRLDTSQRQYGDLIFYQGHVAIYIGEDKVIEALPATGVAVANMWDYGVPLGVGRLFI